MIKHIVFDNGGVLVSSSSKFFIPKYLKYTDKSFATVVKSYRELAKPLDTGRETEVEFYSRFMKHMGIRCSLKEILRHRYAVSKKIPGMLRLVIKLSKHYELFMLNNEYREFMDFLIKKYSMYDQYFKKRVTSFEVGVRKPDVKIFRLFVKKFSLKPHECVFIDDREDNVSSAKSIGMKAVHFQNFEQCVRELRQLGVII
ncbi:MAG: HAD family phosphatase [Nanoarchaeota archaeon]|nr:HAD family phosphatase [Nanoarchaeota archaeon]